MIEMNESKLKQLLIDNEPEPPAIDTTEIIDQLITQMGKAPANRQTHRKNWASRSTWAAVIAATLLICVSYFPGWDNENVKQIDAMNQPTLDTGTLNSISMAADQLEVDLLEQLLASPAADIDTPDSILLSDLNDNDESFEAMQSKIRASESLWLLTDINTTSDNASQLLESLYPETPASIRLIASETPGDLRP